MKKILGLGLILSFLLLPISIYALDGIEIYSGFFNADLKDREDYEGVPLLVSLDFDGRPLLSKFGLDLQGKFYFVLEPFVNAIISPDNNIEAGSNFLIKYVFPLTDKFQPYFKGGLGALYMSQHVKEQSTQYNFLPQGGVGFHYFLNDTTAVGLEYRYRHLSNNSIKSPNNGIDANMFLGGISFFLD